MAAASKKAVQPATRRTSPTLSDKALPSKKAATVKGGLINSDGDPEDPLIP
jgi:hypothetical protein